MADQDHRLLLRVDDGMCRCYVAGKRLGGILNHADVIAVLLEGLVDAFPAGTIYEAAMHEHDGRLARDRRRGR